MANLQEAFQYAAQNPESEFARNLSQLASSGSLDVEAKKYGLDLTPFKVKAASPAENAVETVKATVGGLAKGLGSELPIMGIEWAGRKAIESLPEGATFGGLTKQQILENLDKSPSLQEKFDKMMSADKHPTADTIGNAVGTIASFLVPISKTEKGAEAINAIKEGVTKTGETITRPVRDLADFGKDLATSLTEKAKRITSGVPTEEVAKTLTSEKVLPFIQENPENAKTIAEAFKQGMSAPQIERLASVSAEDKPILKQMKDLAEKASKDDRILERPMDIVGNTGVETLRKLQDINRKAGGELDSVARSLSGQTVDTTPISENALKILSDAGVKITMKNNGEKHVLDFSGSIFKKVPAIQRVLSNALSDLPNLESDAYELHKFKKSLDEVITQGATGEGLKGKANIILQDIRRSADGVLDKNFTDYNNVNSAISRTKEILDQAHAIIGKDTDFFTKQGAQDFGQSLRSLFSNNKSRGRLSSFLQDMQSTADGFGVGSKHNIVDQALFAQDLEHIYGTPAVTGLQGEVSKAIKGAMKFAENPVGASIETGINKIEQMRGISEEAKKQVIDAFLK